MIYDDDGDDFGDWTPEDSYDASDRPGVLLNNLRRRIAALDGGRIDFADDLDDIAARLFHLLQTRPNMTDLELLRGDLLFHDLATVKQLLADE
jgi:hypothetical protein